VAAAALLAGDLSAASPKERLREKQAQAAAVLDQVNQLDSRFEASVEAWNGARYELDLARRKLVVDRRRLSDAERERRVAVARLETRVRAMYEAPDQPTTLSVILGATSVSDLIDRLDTAHAVADADRQLAADTTAARNRYARVARETAATEKRREVALAQRDQERRRIGSMLDERKRLLASVESEVVKLRAEEAARQAKLAAEARARLAAQRAEAAKQARLEQQARAAAAERARRAAATPTTTVAPPATTTTAAATSTTTTAVIPTPASALGPGHPEAATIALRYLGVQYVWGGASPSGFDCSGLVMYVYAQLGVQLPHYAAAQYTYGVAVAQDQLQPGDLVFFDALDHVGIYIGGGQFVHAPHTGDVVKISSLAEFGSAYVGARRL
jgi:cell wall-associated NlpC family hydrolase